MAWIAITEANVVTHISGTELEALRAAAIADGQVDPVQPSIDQATDEVRGYVAACATNPLGDAGTIPERLLNAACDMIVAIIIGRVPGYDIDDPRNEKYKNAIKLLERVASCAFAIEDPNAEDDSSSTPTPSFTGRDRTYTRTQQDGI